MSHTNHRRTNKPPKRPQRPNPRMVLEPTVEGYLRDRPDLGPGRVEFVKTGRALVRVPVYSHAAEDHRGKAIGRAKWKRRDARRLRRISKRVTAGGKPLRQPVGSHRKGAKARAKAAQP